MIPLKVSLSVFLFKKKTNKYKNHKESSLPETSYDLR